MFREGLGVGWARFYRAHRRGGGGFRRTNEASINYSKERQQFGRPISTFQGLQRMMANMATRVQVARHLVYHTAWRKDSGARHSMETALAKLYASETAMWTTAKAVQIHGGMDIPSIFLERYMRDAKITEIYEGANEVQRIVIAVATLKQAGAE